MRTRLKYLAIILAVYALANLSVDETRPWDPRDNRSSLVPLKNLEHLQYGMSESQVAAVLGRPGYCYNPYPEYQTELLSNDGGSWKRATLKSVSAM
jgi:outer membrane protein assembly factor BamE (lipoprotein component of BamABCDE complex)